MEAYRVARESLIIQDRSLRLDRIKGDATIAETKADQVLRKIRAEEAKSVWDADYPSVPHPFPGMEFLTGKKIIVQTKLFALLSKMPKGGLLHVHLDATVNAATLLKLALKQPAIHIRVKNAIDAHNISTTLPEFCALPPDQYSKESTLSSELYVPYTWVAIQRARENFAPTLGGPSAFDQWVVDAMMIHPSEAYGSHNTVKKIWNKFQTVFKVSQGLFHYTPIYAAYVREFFRASIEDGISYVEVRVNFMQRYMVGADGQENIPHRAWVLMFEEAVNDIKAEMRKLGREDEFCGARIIYSTIRVVSSEELEWYLDDCINLKKEFPDTIAGFDLVGDENMLTPLIHYSEPLLRFRERVTELNLDIPFIFHAGETLGDGTQADDNLYDAILLGTKRIGHGFSLVKHPRLMQLCRERQIAVEVCPISNEILRLTSSMPMHPLPILLNHGVPITLCSDDPAVFGNMGLTFDFYQMLVSSELTGLMTLRELARNSLQYSTLSPDSLARVSSAFERRWRAFVDIVVDSCLL